MVNTSVVLNISILNQLHESDFTRELLQSEKVFSRNYGENILSCAPLITVSTSLSSHRFKKFISRSSMIINLHNHFFFFFWFLKIMFSVLNFSGSSFDFEHCVFFFFLVSFSILNTHFYIIFIHMISEIYSGFFGFLL